MNTISLLASPTVELTVPSGLWSPLINWFQSGIGNIGWTILILTIIIRLITSPLDFWTKLHSKKQTLIQQKCAPQIAKIKKKFGNNQQAIRVQTNALYKREGLNMGVGCIVTLVHLVLSLFIFFSFYNALRANSAYQAINQYEILKTTYDDKAYEVLLSRDSEITEYVLSNEDKALARKAADSFTLKYAHGRNLVNKQNEEAQENNVESYDSESPLMTDEEFINFYENNYELLEKLVNDYSKEENYPYNENVYSYLISNSDKIVGYEQKITDNATAESFVNVFVQAKPVFDEKCIEIYGNIKYQEIILDVQNQAENATIEKWNSIKSNWLWIDNIWVADAPTKPFLTYSGLQTIANTGGTIQKIDGKSYTYTDYINDNVNQSSFNAISNIINEKGDRTQNGFYILAILAAAATFLSQFIAEAHNKLKNKKAKTVANATMDPSMNMSMKWMKFIMPIIIVLFVIRSSASFGIYIVASNISAILFGEIINLLVHKMTYKKQKEVEEELEKEANRLIKKGKLQIKEKPKAENETV